MNKRITYSASAFKLDLIREFLSDRYFKQSSITHNNMEAQKRTASVFQGLIIWHPTEKQIKDEDKQPVIIVELKTMLAPDIETARIELGMEIPDQYRKELRQVEVVVRPF